MAPSPTASGTASHSAAPRPTPRGNPATRIVGLWQTLSPLPGGRWLFSRMLGWFVPYSGTIGANVELLEPGHARLTLRDRRRVRQHLGSVHAIALANLAELTSGLSMTMGLPSTTRGIVVSISIEYLKKARGLLVAESRTPIPQVTAETDFTVTAEVRDEASDVVARARVLWRLAPVSR